MTAAGFAKKIPAINQISEVLGTICSPAMSGNAGKVCGISNPSFPQPAGVSGHSPRGGVGYSPGTQAGSALQRSDTIKSPTKACLGATSPI